MSNDGGGTDDARGRLVGGRYRLIERIGSGATGTVWRAHDELAGREVAVRQPRLPGGPEDEHHRRAAHRLHREARAAARVDHPAAVTIHEVVVEPEQRDQPPGPRGPDELDATEMLDGLPWIVMESVRGESLHERLRRGPLEPGEAARVGLAVLGALHAAHSVGIVHRDVKPANVLLGPDDRVVLTDFGIAHPHAGERTAGGGESGAPPEFVAPERMSGRGAGPASDLWSLGALLYTAVEGSSPFRRGTAEATRAAVLESRPPAPERAGPLGPLVSRLLRAEPGERPDAEETAKELAVLAGPVTTAQPAPANGRSTERARETAGAAAAEAPTDVAVTEPPPGAAVTEAPTVPAATRAPVGAAAAQAPTGPTPAGTPTTATPTTATPTTARPAAATPVVATPAAATPAGTPADAATAEAPAAVGTTHPPESPKRSGLLRPAPLALLGALLAGGVGTATQLTGTGSAGAGSASADAGASSAQAAGRVARTAPAADWTPHREPDLAAELHLPGHYRALARTGSATDQPRTVLYGDERGGGVQIRLLRWDRAPGSPLEEARKGEAARGEQAHTEYTPTRVRGHDAVLADTAYTTRDGTPRRVLRLLLRTGGDRLYELRVDMARGTPQEPEGTDLFEGVRDRLGFAKD
ncbi:serine/threonine-protein kinase [Streptomyces sp. AHA2]|uniref:serine/threonine-protein kinase n=1 Tax=Streptomyces sp. AHA2 TaxID=3064526 RepID=UPI002FE18F0F